MSPRVPPDKTLSSAASLYTNESTCLIIDLTLHTLSRSRCTGWAAPRVSIRGFFALPDFRGFEFSSSASASWISRIYTVLRLGGPRRLAGRARIIGRDWLAGIHATRSSRHARKTRFGRRAREPNAKATTTRRWLGSPRLSSSSSS